jgi:energy-coupling factor transporter ATP-binding protein EcfA2
MEVIVPPQDAVLNRNVHLDPLEGAELAGQLAEVLDRYCDQRVLVLGPPASGKSTLLQHIPGVDMDTVFDGMPADFRHHVLHHQYPFMYVNGDHNTVKYDPDSEAFLRATGDMLKQYTDEHLQITPGTPVFGTSLIDTDVLIHLRLSDEALDARIASRNARTHRPVQTARIYALRDIIDEDVENARRSGVTVEDFIIN